MLITKKTHSLRLLIQKTHTIILFGQVSVKIWLKKKMKLIFKIFTLEKTSQMTSPLIQCAYVCRTKKKKTFFFSLLSFFSFIFFLHSFLNNYF